MRTRAHSPELDGVRGVAIAGVMIMHFVGSLDGASMLTRAAVKLSTYGLWGVDLFFVLSGFLITGILYEAKTSDSYYRDFYARRTLRIFPLYYAVLLVLFVLIPASVLSRFDPALIEARRVQAWVWPYLTNVYLAREGSFAIPYVSHFWSLAVEEHFYLVWPILVRVLSLTAILRASVVFSVLAFVLRVTLTAAGVNELAVFALTPCRLDALCIGAWFALAMRDPTRTGLLGQSFRFMPFAALGVFGTSLWHANVGAGDFLVLPLRGFLIAVLFGLVVFAVQAEDGPRLLKTAFRAGWLRSLGKYSYGLYVFHGLVSFAMLRQHTQARFTALIGSEGGGQLAELAAGVGASLLISVTSYTFFESPLLKLKKRFEMSPAG